MGPQPLVYLLSGYGTALGPKTAKNSMANAIVFGPRLPGKTGLKIGWFMPLIKKVGFGAWFFIKSLQLF